LCSPVLANGVLYFASGDTLYAIQDKGEKESAPGYWPQWRGPGRTNVARETGLATTWPKGGPPLAWKAEGLGEGARSVAIAGGRVFTLGHHEDKEYLSALEEVSGKPLWKESIGPAVKESSIMRWLSQRTPTVDGDRIYAVSASGELLCLDVKKGKVLWRKSYPQDFQGKIGPWGYCDYPLVDGDKLICTPGGPSATVVALDKRTGELLWRCGIPDETRGTHAAVIVAEISGVRQYIHQLETGTVGISTTGKLLWKNLKTANRLGNVHTALVKDDLVLCSNGMMGLGAGLVRLSKQDESFHVEELYHNKKLGLDPMLGSSVLLGERVYTSNGLCFEFASGKELGLLEDQRPTRITMCCADPYLIYRFPDNRIVLAEAIPQGFRVLAKFEAPRSSKDPTWSFPVLAGGKLYLRDQDVLLCYDLRERPKKPFREPDVIFVPTPQDVVEKMLELARVQKNDVVYDLGCGDGRIVVTAAKKYGCKGVGYDLDPDCVKLARECVARENLGGLVTVERQDLFKADLQQASVITLYLGTKLNEKLIPRLERLKPGTRIVSHAFDMPGILPERVVRVLSNEDGIEHALYLWTVPFKK
jgi:outer membrane protein assembly factor BamB